MIVISNYHTQCMICSISDPDLSRNATNYRDNHIHKDAAEIILHFINGKYWHMLTNRNGNKLARAMVAYLWEEMWWLHASELFWTVLQWGSKAYLLLRNNGKPFTYRNLTLEDETPNCGPRLGKLVHQFPGVVTLAYDLRLTRTIAR